MSKVRRIGILTGGGDVPGLNSVIKSVVYKSTELGFDVIGIRRGWEGLTHMKPGASPDAGYLRPLDRINTRGIDRSGGTVLHTSRTNPIRIKKGKTPAHVTPQQLEKLRVDENYFDFTPIVLDNIDRLGLDYLIPIGGDDTLSYAQIVAGKGVPLIAVPKTMDNDVRGTEYCIGFSTAITRAKDLITRQRSTLGSHERIGVFRIFGRDSGFTALYSAYVTSARCVLPEVEFDLDALVTLLVEDKRNNPSRYSFVIASEGAVWKGQKVADFGESDAYGHKKKADVGHALAEEIKKRTGEDTMSSDLTYDLRSGEADALDQMVAITFANLAMDLVRDGVSGRMAAIQDGKYTHAPLPDAAAGPRRVDVVRLYNLGRFRPHYSEKLGTPMFLSAEHS